jgi:hypothetical protein
MAERVIPHNRSNSTHFPRFAKKASKKRFSRGSLSFADAELSPIPIEEPPLLAFMNRNVSGPREGSPRAREAPKPFAIAPKPKGKRAKPFKRIGKPRQHPNQKGRK